MSEEITRRRPISRFAEGQLSHIEDEVVTEYPVTIMLNGQEFATLVCTPDYIEDLALGFLASEGMLPSWDSLQEISYDARTGYVYAEVEGIDEWLKASGSKRYLTSCCGKSRQSFVFYNDARLAKPMEGHHVRLTSGQVIRMMSQMQNDSALFKQTGGVHNAALFSQEGELLLSRLDIGRHNALDKIYGYCLRNQLSMAGTTVSFSGRISSEVLLKAAKMRCEVLLSKSAVTDLAIELAEELNMTIIGFIRAQSFNVYTGPERVET